MFVFPKPDKSTPILEQDGKSVLQAWFDFFGYVEAQVKSFAASILAFTSAWTVFTPTITAESGTFTATSATGSFLVIGKLVHFTVVITITTVGSAGTGVVMTLPSGTAVRQFSGGGVEGSTGKGVWFLGIAAGSTLKIRFYDNTFPGASGSLITISGLYEQS